MLILNTSWIISGKIFQMILSLTVGIYSARFLGPSNYGILSLSSAYLTILIPLCTLGISSIFVNEILANPKGEGLLIGSAIGLRLVSSLCAIFINAIVSIIFHAKEQYFVIISIIQSFSLLFQSFDLVSLWYQSKLKSKYPIIVSTLAYIVGASFKIVLLVLKVEVFWFAFSITFESIIIALAYYYIYNKHAKEKLRFSTYASINLLKKSYHYILSALMVAIYGQIAKVMLGNMLSEKYVGLFSSAIALSSIWPFILTAIIDSARPEIIKVRVENKEIYLKKITQLYAVIFWFSIFASIVLVILSKYIISLLYGIEYLEALVPFRIIVWSTGFSYLGVARNIWMVCEEKQKYEKYLATYGAIISFITTFILIKKWGIIGAAVATLITQVLVNLIIPLFIDDLRENSKLILKGIIFKIF